MLASPVGTLSDRTGPGDRPDEAARATLRQEREARRQIFLWFDLDAWLDGVKALVADLDGADQPLAGGLIVEVPETRMPLLLDRLAEMMPSRTAASVRFFVPGTGMTEDPKATFGLDELAAVRTLFDHCADRHLRLAEQLARQGDLGVVFQPVFTAGPDPAPIGYEALLRVRRDDGSLSSPADLFLKASHFGMGAAIDGIARRAVLSTLTETGYQGRIFLNVSGSFLAGKGALSNLLWQLHAARIDPGDVVLELTEWDSDQEAVGLGRAVEGFRNAGFRIAIDDLGAGYSSLARLDMIRPDVVKIDRDLIQGVDANRYELVLLQSVVGIARSIGAEIVAEGIETAGEFETVVAVGVDYVQGFLLGRPQAFPWGAVSEHQPVPARRQ